MGVCSANRRGESPFPPSSEYEPSTPLILSSSLNGSVRGDPNLNATGWSGAPSGMRNNRKRAKPIPPFGCFWTGVGVSFAQFSDWRPRRAPRHRPPDGGRAQPRSCPIHRGKSGRASEPRRSCLDVPSGPRAFRRLLVVLPKTRRPALIFPSSFLVNPFY